jgi:outer membrane protein
LRRARRWAPAAAAAGWIATLCAGSPAAQEPPWTPTPGVGGALGALGAVTAALRQDPELRLLELDVERARGAALAASGAFDRTLGSSAQAGYSQQDLTSAESDAASGEADRRTDWGLDASVAWVVPRRSGLRTTASGTLSGEESDVDLVASLPGGATSTGFDLYSGRVGFQVDLPLARGSGAASVAALERALAIDVEASAAALRHGAAVTARSVLEAYWALAAAGERLAVLEESLASQQRLRELTQALIDTDQLARVEISRSLARQASALGDVEGARRERTAARVALATALGSGLDAVAAAPLATDPLPPAPAAPPAWDPGLLEDAPGRRSDRRSLELLIASGGVLTRAAELDLRPVLDLTAGAGYGRLADSGFDDVLSSSLDGPSAFASVEYQRPLGNRAARGALVEQEAELEGRRVRLADLDRTIRSNVAGAWAELADTIAALERADQAVEFAEQAIAAEVELFRIGSSTLIDTLLTEDRRTAALLTRIDLRLQYALLLTRLRFESGTLLRPTEGGFEVDGDDLVTLPGPR